MLVATNGVQELGHRFHDDWPKPEAKATMNNRDSGPANPVEPPAEDPKDN